MFKYIKKTSLHNLVDITMNKQITAADRKAIEVLLKENYTPSSIAKKLGFHRLTILRH